MIRTLDSLYKDAYLNGVDHEKNMDKWKSQIKELILGEIASTTPTYETENGKLYIGADELMKAMEAL